jgi:hypothetical protein
MVMITKEKDAEDSCPSCRQVLVCREKVYKGETSLQWQYKDKEEAHFSFDFATKKSACKESADSKASTTSSSATTEINLVGMTLSEKDKDLIVKSAGELTERMICVYKGVFDNCVKAGITNPAGIGMIFNQVCATRRSE